MLVGCSGTLPSRLHLLVESPGVTAVARFHGSPRERLRGDVGEDPPGGYAVLERSFENDLVLDTARDEGHDDVVARAEPCRSPRVDLRIVEADSGSPLAVRAVTRSGFTARRDPDVLDGTAAEGPGEVPLGGDRDRGAVGLVVGYGDIPATVELTEQLELVGQVRVRPIRQEHIAHRHAPPHRISGYL